VLACGEEAHFGPFYSVVDAKGSLVRSIGVNLDKPVMMHDFAITAKYRYCVSLSLLFSPAFLSTLSVAYSFDCGVLARAYLLSTVFC
jgi:carotenoid cleavage dioxygenase-like enzyme